jgi:mannose-6-phosphate isomerase-like protein (cupin superfamily)
MKLSIVSMVLAACLVPFAGAQVLTVDHLTQSRLIEKATELDAQAQGPDGTASSKLSEYPNHFTMIALRSKNGGAEIHENYADFFFVVRGSAKLLTGGTVQDAKTVNPGEIRGKAVLNGVETTLNQGDIVHIPATVPHQLLLPVGGTFLYFVIKVKEK